MSYINEVHDATVCSSPSCPCHEWADKQEELSNKITGHGINCCCQQCVDSRLCNDIDTVLAGLSSFAVAWGAAPESRRRYVEREDANYWFEQGEQAERRRVLDDLQEMNRLVEERLR